MSLDSVIIVGSEEVGADRNAAITAAISPV